MSIPILSMLQPVSWCPSRVAALLASKWAGEADT